MLELALCEYMGGHLRRIALIQNQSEMANYSHADCRAALEQLGYDYELFTANSIRQLGDRLAAGTFDCLVLATNALHDKVIRSYFDSSSGRLAVDEFQCSGGGLVVLMQYKAAYESYSFDFVLPSDRPTKAVQRPREESAATSALSSIERNSSPPLLSYPNVVDLKQIQTASAQHPTLPGVYWHWWDVDLSSSWNAHLVCSNGDPARPLLATAQEHLGRRVVMSSLPIDWHGQIDLFENVLLYGCEGRHHAAAVIAGTQPEPSMGYLIAKLHARKVGLREYVVARDQADLIYENILKGVHNTLVLDPRITLEEIFAAAQVQVLRKRFETGEFRTIAFVAGSAPWESSVTVQGRHNPAERAYQQLIPRLSQELARGYLDGSFRSTVSGLQDLAALPLGLDLGVFPAQASLEESSKHDRDGSYDETIGASAALLWLRAKVLGSTHESTRKTDKWLRARLSRVDSREKLYALCVLKEVGLATPTDHDLARTTLAQLIPRQASELELLAFLTGAVRFDHEHAMMAVLGELSHRAAGGAKSLWVDTPTTASLVGLLVEAYDRFPTLQKRDAEGGALLRDLVIPSMIHIEAEYERTNYRGAETGYPWDGKASTAIRCVCAWYRFERYLKAPVDEAASATSKTTQEATVSALSSGAAESLRQLFTDYNELKKDLAKQSEDVAKLVDSQNLLTSMERRLRRTARLAAVFFVTLIAAAYLAADHFIRKFALAEPLGDVGDSILKNWPQHATVAAFLVAALAVPWGVVGRGLVSLLGGRST